MAYQDEGWPLGLRPLNARVGLIRNRDLSAGSVSFSTLITGSSPTSSIDSSSDLDTESTGSFFHDKSITLGSLIGVSGIFDISRRSTRGRRVETSKHRKNHKPKPWLFSWCSKPTSDSVDMCTNTPSLGHFLEAERRARTNNINSKNHGVLHEDGHDNYSPADQPSDIENEDGETRSKRELLEHGNHGFGTPLLLSCLCGQLIK